MPKIFEVEELVSWCASRFDSKSRTIQVAVEGKNLVPLTPKIFKRMLRLLTSNKSLTLPDVDSFMDSWGGGVNLLKDSMAPSAEMSTNPSAIDISLLAKPYQDFSWLSTHLMGQKSTSHILRSALYVFHFSFRNETIFDWAKVISNEISY